MYVNFHTVLTKELTILLCLKLKESILSDHRSMNNRWPEAKNTVSLETAAWEEAGTITPVQACGTGGFCNAHDYTSCLQWLRGIEQLL